MNELTDITDDSEDRRRLSLRHVSLAVRKTDSVEQLAGFRKHHRVPSEVNSHTQAFVGRLATPTIRNDLDQIFSQLRAAFRLKRKEIIASESASGEGEITTPYFRYGSAVYLNPDNASETIWQRDVSQITAPQQLLSDGFATVFDKLFDTVECTPPTPIDLVTLIDHIEAQDDSTVTLEYNRHLTFCELSLPGIESKIRVTQDSFRIVHPRARTARRLLESFFEVQRSLVHFSNGQS
jgi:hypothetical protein